MPKPPGKQFEEDFKSSIPERCDVTRLKDAGGWARSVEMRFTISNPCDITIFALPPENRMMGAYYKLELKTTKDKSLPFKNIKPKTPKLTAKENAIKFTKVLYESEKKGVWAGFVVNFRDVNETYRVEASKVLEFLKTAERESIPIAWFEEHGTLIKQTLKQVHYKYDLEWL